MKIIPQITLNHEFRYRRSNGTWIHYRVFSQAAIEFTVLNTKVSYLLAENTDPQATFEEKYAVILEYEQQYQDPFVCLKYFAPKARGISFPAQTRIFVVTATGQHELFGLSNHGRWHFLFAEKLTERIRYHFEVQPKLMPNPGFYYPGSLRGLPEPLVVPKVLKEPVNDKPVLPVLLPRPPLRELHSERNNPAVIQTPVSVNCCTQPGKISLFELQSRLKQFLIQEKYNQLKIPPRSYQLEDFKKLVKGAQDCEKSIYALVNPAPTGYGKTLFSAMLFSALRVRTLFLVPANILIEQTVNEFKKMIPEARVIGYESKLSFEFVVKNNDVIVTTIQMLQYEGRYKGVFSEAMSGIGYVIFDEAHACISEQRNHIVQMFIQMKCHVLGLTATPLDTVYNAFGYFGDGQGNPIIRRSIIENINLGILPGISLSMIDCPTLYAKKPLQNGVVQPEPVVQPVNDAMQEDSESEEENLDENRIRNLFTDVYFNSADEYTNEYLFGMKTIIFLQRNEEATELAKHFNTVYQVNRQHPKIQKFEESFPLANDFQFAKAVHADVANSEQIIADFKANKIRVLIGVKMIAVGFDDKEVNCVFLPSTNSLTHLIQSGGRGGRTPSELLQMQNGLLVNNKTVHFVQLFLGNKKIKYFFNELKVTINDTTTVKFNHGVKENTINKITLPTYAKIDAGLDVKYSMRTQPNETDKSILRKLERMEIHVIGGVPLTRDQIDKMPKHLQDILKVLDQQHKIIEIKLKNFANVEVHTQHVLQKRSQPVATLDTRTADTSTKKRVIQEADSETISMPRVSSTERTNLVRKLDDVLDQFEEIHKQSGQKRGATNSNKGNRKTTRKMNLQQLLAHMLAKYKALYQHLEMFENELTLQGDAEQFKANLENLIAQATLILPPSKAIKNQNIPRFSTSGYARHAFRKKRVELKTLFAYTLYNLESDFEQAKAVCYVLARMTRQDAIKELDDLIEKAFVSIRKLTKNSSRVNLLNDEQSENEGLKLGVFPKKNLVKTEAIVCGLLSKTIQYLALDEVSAKQLLMRIPPADLLAVQYLEPVTMALLLAANIQQINDLPNWSDHQNLQILFNRHLQLLNPTTQPITRMSYAYQYKMFNLLYSLFHDALAQNKIQEIPDAALTKYVQCILDHTPSILELLDKLRAHLDSALAQFVLEKILKARNSPREIAFTMKPRQWLDGLSFIDAMLENQFIKNPEVFQDFYFDTQLSTQELGKSKSEEFRPNWLMLPQLASQLQKHQSLGPYIPKYCKERILLLYLYMKDKQLLNDHLESLLVEKLSDSERGFEISYGEYSSAMFKRIFEAYLQFNPNLPLNKQKEFLHHCIKRLSTSRRTVNDLKLLMAFTLKQIQNNMDWCCVVACELIVYSFQFVSDLALEANQFIEHDYKPLLAYAAASKEMSLGGKTTYFEQYFSVSTQAVVSPDSSVLANQMFELLYSAVKNKIKLKDKIDLLAYYCASESAGMGVRLVTLQQSLKLSANEVLWVFMKVWLLRTLKSDQFWNTEVLSTLYHFYDQTPNDLCSFNIITEKIGSVYPRYILDLKRTSKSEYKSTVWWWVSYPKSAGTMSIDFLLLLQYTNLIFTSLLEYGSKGCLRSFWKPRLSLLDVIADLKKESLFANFYNILKSQINFLQEAQYESYSEEQRPRVFAEHVLSAFIQIATGLSELSSQQGYQDWALKLGCQYPQETGDDVVSEFALQQLQDPSLKELVLKLMKCSSISVEEKEEKSSESNKDQNNNDDDDNAFQEDEQVASDDSDVFEEDQPEVSDDLAAFHEDPPEAKEDATQENGAESSVVSSAFGTQGKSSLAMFKRSDSMVMSSSTLVNVHEKSNVSTNTFGF